MKLFTKTIVNRLNIALPFVIDVDQSYCIKNRSIYNNVHLVRDCIDITNIENSPLAIISLDQTKAFDRIHHDYMFLTLKSFGFSPLFISLIKTAYCNTERLLKINGFKFGRGIRQGCSCT